jgi:hypothetical protein
MPIFVMFVFGSVIFGAGAMLAPALPSKGPRVGTAGALVLALVLTGTLFWAALFEWDVLIIDYLWFAVLVGIFLTGTMSAGMYRSEADGGIKEYAGYPGPRELCFFLTVGMLFAIPALTVPVPLDTDAQGFGYLALVLKNSGSLTTLAPYHPDITWLYSPGFPALVAYLGTQLNAGLHNIQLAVGAVLAFLFVWLAYDFGNELVPDDPHQRRTGIAMACASLIGIGLALTNLDSHYTAQLGLVFSLAFITFVLRFYRHGKPIDFVAAAVTLAGVPLAQPDMTIILMLGYVPWLFTMWFAREGRPPVRRWFGLAVGIPLLAVLGISPWIAEILPLLGSDIRSPFEIETAKHLTVMVVYHGGVILLLVIPGIVLALRRRSAIDLMMLVWIVLVIDAAAFGVLKALTPFIPIWKYDYPFSIAWHGPIIPYMYFGGTAILWIIDRVGRQRAENLIRAASLPVMCVAALSAVFLINSMDQVVLASKSTPLRIFGAFSSRADVQAMQWLGQNTAQDVLILNHPGPQEGDWVPVIAQRDTVYFRPQPFFKHTERVDAMQQDFLAFWRNPDDPANKELFERYGVDYLIVPQIVARPESLINMYRWRPPPDDVEDYPPIRDLPYLELVFEMDGARIYQFVP